MSTHFITRTDAGVTCSFVSRYRDQISYQITDGPDSFRLTVTDDGDVIKPQRRTVQDRHLEALNARRTENYREYLEYCEEEGIEPAKEEPERLTRGDLTT